MDIIEKEVGELFKSVEDKFPKTLALISHEQAKDELSPERASFVSALGFVNTKNMKQYEAKQEKLAQLGVEKETITQLKEIKKTYGKNIISYKQLSNLCKKHKLYFGPSELFIGTIPDKNLTELEVFNFDKFKSHYNSLESVQDTGILSKQRCHTSKTMIVAPSNQFKLQNVFISLSNEIIRLEGNKGRCKNSDSSDPIVILPFSTNASKEVYFVILTAWNLEESLI